MNQNIITTSEITYWSCITHKTVLSRSGNNSTDDKHFSLRSNARMLSVCLNCYKLDGGCFAEQIRLFDTSLSPHWV